MAQTPHATGGRRVVPDAPDQTGPRPESRRRRLLALLREELREAHEAALAAGVPAEALAETITDRTAALIADAEDRSDHPDSPAASPATPPPAAPDPVTDR